jgi:hypothetical protein
MKRILRFLLPIWPGILTIGSASLIVSQLAAEAVDRPNTFGVVVETIDEGGGSTSGLLAAEPWSDYRAIMWHPQEAEQCAALKEVGIDAGAVILENRERPAQGFERSTASLRDCGIGWYVENIATDFYSNYHRFSQVKPVNWRFVEVKKAYRANPADPRAFTRDPSLSDPAWHAKIRERLMETVRVHRAHRPLYYDLADEPGIADLSAFWDFDVSRHSLEGMRRWLKERYPDLAGLNAQWGSRFSDWDSVVPMTTAEAMKRSDNNDSSWAAFTDLMDTEFARALALGRQAVHDADPLAYAGIEGAQVPGWGGYDYTRLASAVDLMEPYDGGGNFEIVRALNPRIVLLTTSYSGETEAHRLWRQLLRGSRGVIFWDPKSQIVSEDGRIGDRGRSIAPHLREIKGGLGALLIHSHRQTAPVAVLYSPASMRAQWMLDWQPKGTAWSDREPAAVYEDESAVRSSMAGFFDTLGRVGLEGRVLTPELIEQGALERDIRVLILPRVLALSEREAAEIRRFVAKGGTVIADGVPGQFDQHCRLLPQPSLSDLFMAPAAFPRAGQRKAILLDTSFDDAGDASRRNRDDEVLDILSKAGVEPMFRLESQDGSRATTIETHLWQNGGTTILALQRELGSAAVEPVRLALREPARVYDLRSQTWRGTLDTLELTIDPIVPTLLALSSGPEPAPAITGEARAVGGGTVTMTFSQPQSTGSRVSVLRVEIVDPRGDIVADRSANVILRGAPVARQFPFAATDTAGKWQIRARDVLTGATAAHSLELESR